jgi:hypothetical protein
MSHSRTHVVVSFVVRNPALSLEQFSQHYGSHHGPLAAKLPAFRMYVSRYIQNHLIEKLSGVVEIDGVTVLTQVPREDYTVGFFQHPDFKTHVQDDSHFLFDVSKNRAFLGVQQTQQGGLGFHKLLLLSSVQQLDSILALLSPGKSRVTEFGGGMETAAPVFGYDRMIEAWFESADALHAYMREVKRIVGDGAEAWRVGEVLIYDRASTGDDTPAM